ncbi:MAG: nuclear transport factor 2 family protein [Cyclobacteriaceae bacterium]|nr:nuclear transport factor 2 family protein [Cyclobacteriaceae bacterium]
MKILILVGLIGLSLGAHGQGSENLAIMAPVERLFKGMNLGDSAMVHSAFTKEVTMATIMKDKTGKQIVRRESSLAGFLKAVGTPHVEPWSEPIWDTKIEVDGTFAQVWAQYAFYSGKKFSHCGVDAFHLVKEETGWKIFHLTDTRHTADCHVPAEVSNQFK